ncbi:YgjV family protein [Hyphococcus flavus]|uniref:YgjV family protein n=1 Tax=Hyphococcus flavus TaxID=1866326 RepID=A0AAF0CFB1_9PROT|nr:YgjV family protein [Hyphococcus flavus]WDI30703.1 YgjV family protein [Hyphococcus flavus]
MDLLNETIVGHILGAIGLGLIMASWQFKTRQTILTFNIIAFVFFAAQLQLLGAYVGAAMMAFAIIFTLAALYSKNIYLAGALILTAVVIGIVRYENWYDFLPILANIFGIYAFFSQTEQKLRLLAPIGTILWGIHNIFAGAWSQFIADLFILASMALGYWRASDKKISMVFPYASLEKFISKFKKDG